MPDPRARLVVDPHTPPEVETKAEPVIVHAPSPTSEPPSALPPLEDVDELLDMLGFAAPSPLDGVDMTAGDDGIEIPDREDMLIAAFEAAADPQQDRWLRDPVAWVKERLDGFLWSKQIEIMRSVCANPRTAARTSHTVGKSFLAAIIALWWIDVHPPGSAFVITTAPTGAQVKAILWRYINRLHASHQLPGRMNQTEWYLGNEMVALGRKPSDYTPDAFQGIHAEYVLAILDESGGVDETIWNSVSTMTSNEGSRTLAIGNPDDPSSYFAVVCEPGSGWNVIGVSAFETPNMTGEEVPPEVARSLVSRAWVEDRAKVWGTDSPIYVSKVLGEFPTDAEDGVIPVSFVTPCRHLEEAILPEEPIQLGVDVGETTDRTIVVERHGGRVYRIHTVSHRGDAMSAVGQIVDIVNRTGASIVTIDVIGLGWGVYSRLRELSRADNPTGAELTHSARIIRFSAAETADDAVRFYNRRAELWWDVGRELSRLKRWDLTNLDDDAVAELTAPHYRLEGSKGRIIVESKAEIRKRLGRSTDVADALLMAFYEGDPPPPPARFPRENRTLAETSLIDDGSSLGIAGPR